MHHKKQKLNPTLSEESNKMSQKTPSQDSHSKPKISPLGSCYNYKKLEKEGLVDNTEEMMQAIIDAEDIDYNDMAGG